MAAKRERVTFSIIPIEIAFENHNHASEGVRASA